MYLRLIEIINLINVGSGIVFPIAYSTFHLDIHWHLKYSIAQMERLISNFTPLCLHYPNLSSSLIVYQSLNSSGEKSRNHFIFIYPFLSYSKSTQQKVLVVLPSGNSLHPVTSPSPSCHPAQSHHHLCWEAHLLTGLTASPARVCAHLEPEWSFTIVSQITLLLFKPSNVFPSL